MWSLSHNVRSVCHTMWVCLSHNVGSVCHTMWGLSVTKYGVCLSHNMRSVCHRLWGLFVTQCGVCLSHNVGLSVTQCGVCLSHNMGSVCHTIWGLSVTQCGVCLSHDVGSVCHTIWGLSVTQCGVCLSHNLQHCFLHPRNEQHFPFHAKWDAHTSYLIVPALSKQHTTHTHVAPTSPPSNNEQHAVFVHPSKVSCVKPSSTIDRRIVAQFLLLLLLLLNMMACLDFILTWLPI